MPVNSRANEDFSEIEEVIEEITHEIPDSAQSSVYSSKLDQKFGNYQFRLLNLVLALKKSAENATKAETKTTEILENLPWHVSSETSDQQISQLTEINNFWNKEISEIKESLRKNEICSGLFSDNQQQKYQAEISFVQTIKSNFDSILNVAKSQAKTNELQQNPELKTAQNSINRYSKKFFEELEIYLITMNAGSLDNFLALAQIFNLHLVQIGIDLIKKDQEDRHSYLAKFERAILSLGRIFEDFGKENDGLEEANQRIIDEQLPQHHLETCFGGFSNRIIAEFHNYKTNKNLTDYIFQSLRESFAASIIENQPNFKLGIQIHLPAAFDLIFLLHQGSDHHAITAKSEIDQNLLLNYHTKLPLLFTQQISQALEIKADEIIHEFLISKTPDFAIQNNADDHSNPEIDIKRLADGFERLKLKNPTAIGLVDEIIDKGEAKFVVNLDGKNRNRVFHALMLRFIEEIEVCSFDSSANQELDFAISPKLGCMNQYCADHLRDGLKNFGLVKIHGLLKHLLTNEPEKQVFEDGATKIDTDYEQMADDRYLGLAILESCSHQFLDKPKLFDAYFMFCAQKKLSLNKFPKGEKTEFLERYKQKVIELSSNFLTKYRFHDEVSDFCNLCLEFDYSDSLEKRDESLHKLSEKFIKFLKHLRDSEEIELAFGYLKPLKFEQRIDFLKNFKISFSDIGKLKNIKSSQISRSNPLYFFKKHFGNSDSFNLAENCCFVNLNSRLLEEIYKFTPEEQRDEYFKNCMMLAFAAMPTIRTTDEAQEIKNILEFTHKIGYHLPTNVIGLNFEKYFDLRVNYENKINTIINRRFKNKIYSYAQTGNFLEKNFSETNSRGFNGDPNSFNYLIEVIEEKDGNKTKFRLTKDYLQNFLEESKNQPDKEITLNFVENRGLFCSAICGCIPRENYQITLFADGVKKLFGHSLKPQIEKLPARETSAISANIFFRGIKYHLQKK